MSNCTDLMQVSSSSSISDDIYDVFLSFRGADTRNGFTDHLYNALMDAGVNTFLDDEEIETGKQLKPELGSAIKSARASIIVLSENYASSTWCLDELVLILDQNTKFNQIVIPIFYHVEPTNVRKQKHSFGGAMEKHREKMRGEKNEVKRIQWGQKIRSWKKALTQVADLKGLDANNRKESEFIKEVVIDIQRRLGVPSNNRRPLMVGGNYINEMRSISSWLTDGSCHIADVLTIVGMGGIGKTSLARYVFMLHSRTFHKSCFIEGINTRCNEKSNGLLKLQKQLHGDLSKKIQLRVNDVYEYTSKIENALKRNKVFVVLDDIHSLDQLDALLGRKGFHPGSKIIITTKDASLTERCSLFNPQVQPKHKTVSLDGLTESESLVLLCIHAFKRQNPKEGYKEVSENLVKYCEGHPLALEVLGKSLNTRDVAYWEECINGLKKEPHSHINKALKMSLESLPLKNDKELFKYIACFFVGVDRDLTETILKECDLNTRSGITNLIDRHLLRIGWKNKLMMHQLVQEMGRDLVRQESPDKPWERSRLWCHEESFKVLKQKKGQGNLLGLALDMKMLDKKKVRGSLELTTDSLSNMDNLMLLQLNYVQLKGSFDKFPEELRWLCLHGFPLKSIPPELSLEYLVALDMSYSNIVSFGMCYTNTQQLESGQKLSGSGSKDKRLLGLLKILDLSFCQQLHSLGGFFELPALERLIVKNCISLIEACELVEQCVELFHIDLSYCYKLKKLPIGKLKKVKTLFIEGCNYDESQTEIRGMSSSDSSLNSQTSSYNAIMEATPSDFKFFAISLPSSLIFLSLANNNLSNESFPMDMSCLSMLEELCLDNNPIRSMPNCVRSLPRLKELSMRYCDKLRSIEHPPPKLRRLSVEPSLNHLHVRKIKFDPQMSPLNFYGGLKTLEPWSLEIDGMVKIQPLVDVEEKVLNRLGWKSLESIKERHWGTCYFIGSNTSPKTQMLYEFGIFSTFYEGKEMPEWINEFRSDGPSISFTIPSSVKKLRGLNFCCVEMYPQWNYFKLPMIKISNITKEHTWIYDHYVEEFDLGGKCLNFLSHWMFGPNEMRSDDEITITVEQIPNWVSHTQVTKQCGVTLVYEDGMIEEEDEDALDYYKSWNHIIGGDLSGFQLATPTGEYLLYNMRFQNRTNTSRFRTLIAHGASYKADVGFKAFSQTVGQDVMK
ncbi:putative TIR domain, P-loop containing nucleoside triphosphate hydrolase [Helianthus debilis subsp. tardiflorus]